jgi:hypothetical protein
MFLHVQSIQTSKVDNPCFFQTLFFLSNAHHFFRKLEKIFTLMIRRAKRLELMIFFLITDLNTFDSKMFLTLKIMDFENVPLTKLVHISMIEGMNA